MKMNSTKANRQNGLNSAFIFSGYINIPASEISGRSYVEKWFNSMSGTVGRVGKENKSENPLIRIKARYHTVQILPVDTYQEFSQVMSEE